MLEPDDLLTPQELAERLKTKVSWVYEQTRSRASVRSGSDEPLPYIRMGKYLRFHWPDVAKWLEDRQSNGGHKK